MNALRPNFRALAAGIVLACAGPLPGCTLEAAALSCADCGQVRAIVSRQSGPAIRPHAITTDNVVWDVRVRMDRGGSRDFTLPQRNALRVGDRVEVREGRLVPVTRLVSPGLT